MFHVVAMFLRAPWVAICWPGSDLQGRSLVHLAAMSETLVPLEFVHRRLLMDVAFAEVRYCSHSLVLLEIMGNSVVMLATVLIAIFVGVVFFYVDEAYL